MSTVVHRYQSLATRRIQASPGRRSISYVQHRISALNVETGVQTEAQVSTTLYALRRAYSAAEIGIAAHLEVGDVEYTCAQTDLTGPPSVADRIADGGNELLVVAWVSSASGAYWVMQARRALDGTG